MFSSANSLNEAQGAVTGRTPLAERSVVVLDCQATGASPQRGHLLELGWATMRACDGEPPRRHTELAVLPMGESVPPQITRLTGIRDDDLLEAPTPAQIWARVRALSRVSDVAVIHYARFEESFVRPLHAKMTGDDPFPFEVVCTHGIARRLWPDLPRCGLRAVAGYLGYPAEQLRRCSGHLGATAHVWSRVVPLLRERFGIDDLPALRQWLTEPAPRSGARVYPMPRDKRLALPESPGVYRMLRSNGDILYIGKATSLRRRVNGYFQKQSRVAERTLEMLSQALDVHVQSTPTALEAALLETDEIKTHAPPYNVALRGTGRSLWYASRGFSSLAPECSAQHPIGPLSSAWWPERYAALLLALRGAEPPIEALNAALGRGSSEAEPELLTRGLAEFRHRLPPGGLVDDRTMMRFGALRWMERKAAEALPDIDEPHSEDDQAEFSWDPDRVVAALEDLVLVVAHAVRRGAWLRRLSESSVAWSEPGRGAVQHVLVMSAGAVHARDRIAPGALPPIAPGIDRPVAARNRSFDLATYDRLRVLTTELRRIANARASVQVRVGAGRPLSGERLKRTLAWV